MEFLSFEIIVFTLEISKILTQKVKVGSKTAIRGTSMKAPGRRASLMDRESKSIAMGIATKESRATEENLDMEPIRFIMAPSTRDRFTTTKVMVLVNSLTPTETITMENGNWASFMDLESLCGLMESITKENIWRARGTVKENIHSKMEATIRGVG
jgi:hypothetical protein